ncbi:unnamed protein product [Schistosoma spindalis]|nr:unnamed protein product [Schistosoma spindale]
MVQFKFYPSQLPIFAVCHALYWLPIGYMVAISYDHVQPFVPFLSSLGIYPPEKYMFTWLMGSYGVMTTISQWFWSSMMRKKFQQRIHSRIGQYTCKFIALLYTVSGICIVLLSIFNMKDTNQLHYRLTMVNFFCQAAAMLLGSLLVFWVYRPMKWFLIARIIVTLQIFLGSYFFVYFNRAGLLVFDGENIYYIREHEPGYTEFNKCAISLYKLNSISERLRYHYLLGIINNTSNNLAFEFVSLYFRTLVVYFNQAGLLVLQAKNLFYIKENEPGYKEFNQCAISEWFVILGLIEITLITGLELRTYENQYEEINKSV